MQGFHDDSGTNLVKLFEILYNHFYK